MKRYHMGRKKTGDIEETEQLLLRPRKTLIKRLEDAAGKAKRFINRNQVAIEILERYLPFWEEIERQHEAAVDAQFKQMNGDREPRQSSIDRLPSKNVGRKKGSKKTGTA
jgi:hypothetical protein